MATWLNLDSILDALHMATVHAKDIKKADDDYDKTRRQNGLFVANVGAVKRLWDETTIHTFAALEELETATKELKKLKREVIHQMTLDSDPAYKGRVISDEEAERVRAKSRADHRAKYAHFNDDEYEQMMLKEEQEFLDKIKFGSDEEREALAVEMRKMTAKESDDK